MNTEQHDIAYVPRSIGDVVIKKGYLLGDGKSTAKTSKACINYFHSRSVNDSRRSLKLTLKFRYGTFSISSFDFVIAIDVEREI